MRRAFPLVEQWFFSWTPNVLVAERDESLLGAVVLKLFALRRDLKGGLIYWVFTAPEARGLGAGQRLVEAGIDFLERHGCSEIFACVEGNNTSSLKLFSTRGFRILSPGAQFRRFGLAALTLWVKTFHYVDVGHFLHVRPSPRDIGRPALQWWGTLAANSLVGLLMLWRVAGFGSIDHELLLSLPLALGLLFGLRHASMRLAAHVQGLAVRFRAWESGFPVSALIALAAGVLYPVPGNIYPAADRWRYRDTAPELGRIALAGTLPVLLLVWAIWALLRLEVPPPGLRPWLNTALLVGRSLALFDTVLAFFPFVGFNGRRLWDWNKTIWAMVAAAAVAALFV